MNIIVCVKQVPNTQKISIDPETNTLIRDGVESVVNPYCAYALEAAARLKDKDKDSKIYVLSMGPQQAETALRECLAIAADSAYLACDKFFAGSDTLATSYILSESIKNIEAREGIKFDMVFCGKQAIDGDTAQVGPQIAECLGMPQITYALTCERKDEELHVLKETEEGKEVVAIKFPCMVTFTKPNFEPRFPSFKRRSAAKKLEIGRVVIDDLGDIDRTKVGLKGSPTKVRKTYVPQLKKGGIIFKEGPLEDSGKKLAEVLVENKIITSITQIEQGGQA